MAPALECDMAKLQESRRGPQLQWGTSLSFQPWLGFWALKDMMVATFIDFHWQQGSLSTVLSNWHPGFRSSEMRTPQCYANSKTPVSLWYCHPKSLSTHCALGTLLGGEGGVWMGVGALQWDLWMGLVWLVVYLWIIVGKLCLSLNNSAQRQSVSEVSLWCSFNESQTTNYNFLFLIEGKSWKMLLNNPWG